MVEVAEHLRSNLVCFFIKEAFLFMNIFLKKIIYFG